LLLETSLDFNSWNKDARGACLRGSFFTLDDSGVKLVSEFVSVNEEMRTVLLFDIIDLLVLSIIIKKGDIVVYNNKNKLKIVHKTLYHVVKNIYKQV
jgi:signal peptidase I